MALDSVNPPPESILSGDEQRMAVDLEDGEIEDGEIEDDEITDTISKVSVQKANAPIKRVPPKLEPPVIDASMTPRTREPAPPRRREPLLPNPPASKRIGRMPVQPSCVRPIELDEVEDDWAGNVEKAIKAAMEKEKNLVKKEQVAEIPDTSKVAAASDDEMDDRKDKNKKKKRKKKYKSDEEVTEPKKHKKTHKKSTDGEEAGRSDVHDDEMLYVRGASPVMKASGSPAQDYHDYQYHEMSTYEESYESYGEDDSNGEDRRDYSPHSRREGSPPKRGMGRGFKRRPMRGRGAVMTRRPVRRDMVKGKRLPTKRPMRGNQEQSRDMCVFFLQGKCQKGDDCPYSHEVNPPRKLELCKFYLNNCCAKKDKCLYMHNDFPCKFYHMGMKCYAGDRCKFSHGHLSETMRAVLLKVSGKHLETAPKEILGDFPRLSREGANAMIYKKSRGKGGADSRKIPSLFEIEVPLTVQLMAEEKARRDSPSLSGTPVPDSDEEDQDGSNTPMPSSPKSDSAFSTVSKVRRWEQEDTSDQSHNLHIDEEEEGGLEQEQGTVRDGSIGEEDSMKTRRSSEKKSKRKRDGSSQQPGSSRARSGDESGEDPELRRIHKEERQLKKRLKEESKRNAKEERRLRRTLREERRKRIALDKERSLQSSMEVNQENLSESCFMDDQLQDEVPARSNSPWEEPDLNYGRVESQFKDVKQEMKTEHLFSSSQAERSHSRSPDQRQDMQELGFLQMHLPTKQDVSVPDPGDSGTDSNDGTNIPVHLPKKQRELFLRIQQQQREAESSQEHSKNEESNEEEAEEENWYSSDDEEASLANVLKNLSSQQTSNATPSQQVHNIPATPSAPAGPAFGSLNLSDLSQIDISESVSQLLSSIRHASSASTASSSVTQPSSTMTVASSDAGMSAFIDVGSYGNEALRLSSDFATLHTPEQKQTSPSQQAAPQICTPSVVRDPRLLRDPRNRSAANIAPPSNPPGLLSPSSADGRRVDPRSIKPADDKGKVCARRSSVVDAPNVYGNAITSPSQTMGISLAGQGDVDLRTMEGVADVDLRSAHVADIDLRQSYFDYGDTDLRLSSGTDGNDVDLRKMLGLPFKPVPMHMPATEIDASLTSHPPIPYKLIPVTIPRPDYSKLKINPSDPQVFRDPRLRKLFKLPSSPPPTATVSTVFAVAPAVPIISASRVDPRRARAAAQQAMLCQDPSQQPQPQPQLPPQPQQQMMQQQQLPHVQPDMFMPMVPQPPIMMPGMIPDPMLPRPGPTPGLLGIAPPGFLGVPQMGFCPPPTPRFEEDEDDDEDEDESGETDVDLRRMYGWEHHSRGHTRGNRRRWRGGANNRRRRADHSTPA